MPLAVVALALLVRVPPALRGYNHSNDAAEYLLIARSLASGQGFTLPIKVRFNTSGPVVHEAYDERAPLWPYLLSIPVRFSTYPGWPEPWLQLTNVFLAALATLLGTLLTADLARRRGLRGRSLAWVAFLGGVSIAWFPNHLRASVHLWAEPLGLVLILAAFRHWLALEHQPSEARAEASNSARAKWNGEWTRVASLGLLAGLARYARPEAWILVPLFLGFALHSGRHRRTLALAAVFLALNVLGTAMTGVVAPQLELLRVRNFVDMMTPQHALPPTTGEVAAGVLSNVVEQLKFMLAPRRAGLVVPLALVATRDRSSRTYLLTALALFLATAFVWSTSDPSRFSLAPLCLLGPPAAVEFLRICRRIPWRWALPLAVSLWVGLFAQRAASEAHKHQPPPPHIHMSKGTLESNDPWRLALLHGHPAKLAGYPQKDRK